nr:hypothetical protein CFP56_00252 [Quercus suber]
MGEEGRMARDMVVADRGEGVCGAGRAGEGGIKASMISSTHAGSGDVPSIGDDVRSRAGWSIYVVVVVVLVPSRPPGLEGSIRRWRSKTRASRTGWARVGRGAASERASGRAERDGRRRSNARGRRRGRRVEQLGERKDEGEGRLGWPATLTKTLRPARLREDVHPSQRRWTELEADPKQVLE